MLDELLQVQALASRAVRKNNNLGGPGTSVDQKISRCTYQRSRTCSCRKDQPCYHVSIHCVRLNCSIRRRPSITTSDYVCDLNVNDLPAKPLFPLAALQSYKYVLGLSSNDLEMSIMPRRPLRFALRSAVRRSGVNLKKP